MEKAIFAGGCFWCMEGPFKGLDGVDAVISGYIGGEKDDPTYEEVCSGSTGHTEAVEITYDPSKVAYEKLLEIYWMNIDPTTPNQQFADIGTQYRTGIFYHNEKQRELAEISRDKLAQTGKFDKTIVTEITPATTFYPAEDHHQDYSNKNPDHYNMYRIGSGRQDYLERTWGKKK